MKRLIIATAIIFIANISIGQKKNRLKDFFVLPERFYFVNNYDEYGDAFTTYINSIDTNVDFYVSYMQGIGNDELFETCEEVVFHPGKAVTVLHVEDSCILALFSNFVNPITEIDELPIEDNFIYFLFDMSLKIGVKFSVNSYEKYSKDTSYLYPTRLFISDMSGDVFMFVMIRNSKSQNVQIARYLPVDIGYKEIFSQAAIFDGGVYNYEFSTFVKVLRSIYNQPIVDTSSHIINSPPRNVLFYE